MLGFLFAFILQRFLSKKVAGLEVFPYVAAWKIRNVKLDTGELPSFAVYTRIPSML